MAAAPFGCCVKSRAGGAGGASSLLGSRFCDTLNPACQLVGHKKDADGPSQGKRRTPHCVCLPSFARASTLGLRNSQIQSRHVRKPFAGCSKSA